MAAYGMGDVVTAIAEAGSDVAVDLPDCGSKCRTGVWVGLERGMHVSRLRNASNSTMTLRQESQLVFQTSSEERCAAQALLPRRLG